MSVPSLGIVRLEATHHYVRDLARFRAFLTERCDFSEIGVSGPDHESRTGMHTVAFKAGECVVLASTPLRPDSDAGRWLARHPEGVGELVFQVEDAAHAFALLDARGGTPTSDVVSLAAGQGAHASFAITTPIGDTRFRFSQRTRFTDPFPGFVPHPTPKGGSNRFGFLSFDHVTNNFVTMAPFLLWCEHVLGFERYWKVQFHTDDVSGARSHGSGLRSVVMWDPRSGVKFANNEPMRPHFNASQIQVYVDDNRGDGVQHAALLISDIEPVVRGLREAGVPFLPTPGSYYDLMPSRLQTMGVGSIDEDIATLRALEILVDGAEEHRYLLQIFMKDMAAIHGDPAAGPFFFEIIQRKGDRGFGAGNFRALFESIEREQVLAGKV